MMRLKNRGKMNSSPKENKQGTETNRDLQYYQDRFSEYYSPVSLITIVLLFCIVFLLFGRISKQLDVNSIQFKLEPIVNINSKTFQHFDTTLQDKYNKPDKNNDLWIAIPIKCDSSNIYSEDKGKRKSYIFHNVLHQNR